jgi:SAM-dependent methyltransferase
MFWGEHDPDLFIGTERFFRPGYATHLTAEWIPALSGVEQKLQAGAKIADVGCGHGASTLIMAQAYPKSRLWGFDSHEGSIEHARQRAAKAGVSDRVTFEVIEAAHLPVKGYDLVCFFDCLHDMGRAVEACRRVYDALAPEGSVLIVEPMAGNRIEENFNPIGRTFSGASTLCCTPNAMAHGGPALGAVATEEALAQVVRAAGFTRFRRATQTPFNRIFEARR